MYSLTQTVFFFFAALSGISAQQAQQSPVVVQSYKDFHALDCYLDPNVQQRVLRHFVGTPDNMTVESCLDICADGGFALGGVEFGRECYCGNAILFSAVNNTGGCNMPCVGSAQEACGGAGNIEIYQNGNMSFTTGEAQLVMSYKQWTADGCFQDSASRNVPNRLPLSKDTMTVEGCLNACEAAKFNVASLQDGEECYCGNVALPAGQSVCVDDCNLPCSGNATEFCGAADLNWVFFLPSAKHN